MTHVVTLLSDPRAPAITDAVLKDAAQLLDATGPARRLDAEVAADIPVEARDLDRRVETLRAELRSLSVDIVAQPLAQRRKRLFLADMDSTMIEQECIDELADYVGFKSEVADITERAMRGEIAFEPALCERVALLEGLQVGVVDEIIRERIELVPGATTLVATLRANGVYTCLVSGGFTLFTGPIAERLGFDEHRSNRLMVENGRLAGCVEEPILGREAKRATLEELRHRFALRPEETLAVGDGANDLAMLGEAGLGVAFRAKPAVAEAAGARIDHCDLTGLLYVQGYTATEFDREDRQP